MAASRIHLFGLLGVTREAYSATVSARPMSTSSIGMLGTKKEGQMTGIGGCKEGVGDNVERIFEVMGGVCDGDWIRFVV